MIKKDFYVCGAAFNNEFLVKHYCVKDINEINKLRKAKYVQSSTEDCFYNVIHLLRNGDKVLFSGTPCQCAGLKRLAEYKKCSENLFLIDIVCHGVPSPLVFKDYINTISDKYGTLSSVEFRNKKFGWRGQNQTIETYDSLIFNDDTKSFEKIYFNNMISMDACSECQYTNISRVGDITIGDFWGIENVNSGFNDNKGVSLVLINSEKGNIIFNQIYDSRDKIEINDRSFLQPNLICPTKPSRFSKKFWKIYKTKGYINSYIFVQKVINKQTKLNKLKTIIRNIF